jgi:hypothetical protein
MIYAMSTVILMSHYPNDMLTCGDGREEGTTLRLSFDIFTEEFIPHILISGGIHF